MENNIPIPEDLGINTLQQWFVNQFGPLVAGVDEAGRGPVSGPVVAAAVILNPEAPIQELNDSKKLTEKKREKLFDEIQRKAFSFGIGICSPEEIDEINILNATFLGMRRALEQLSSKPSITLVDGNHKIREYHQAQLPLVKGDSRVASIAAASILAKVTRDRIMHELHEEFPDYNWAKNKGYPSKEHIEAIQRKGYSIHHRKTFRIKALDQFSLDLSM